MKFPIAHQVLASSVFLIRFASFTFLKVHFLAPVIAVLVLAGGAASPGYGQALSSFDRERGRMMLEVIKDDIRKNYYDPNFRGIDLDERFKVADDKIKQATSIGQVFGIVAQFAIELEDSHTVFLPPSRSYQTEYGWQMQVIGDKTFVVAVKPGSDAEKKGLQEGDGSIRLMAGA